jgi:ABC-type transport system substrate-binding protein
LAKASATNVGVPWLMPFDIAMAEKLLDQAGFPKKADGTRFAVTLQAYPAEAGEVSLTVADAITSQWSKLGLKIDQLREDYGGVISPRMRLRQQFLPVLKNGDVHSNVYPLDLPPPPVDGSISRPGWGVGWEAKPITEWNFAINASKDKATREKMHIDYIDYAVFWQLYGGIFQVTKGLTSGKRVKSWNGTQLHYNNWSTQPEFIVLN